MNENDFLITAEQKIKNPHMQERGDSVLNLQLKYYDNN